MFKFVDQIGQNVDLKNLPQRIISLVPSQTELLIDLGLSEKLIGCTKFCVYPNPMPRHVHIIGGTKNPKIAQIKSLNPDLIIANKEENNFQDIEAFKSQCPVWVSDVNSITDAFAMIEGIGKLTNTVSRADSLNKKIKSDFSALKEKCAKLPSINVAYFIWKKPIMVAGDNNFINSILELINLKNLWGNSTSRYPSVTPQEIKLNSPKFILLSSEPYPFEYKHCMEMNEHFPQSKSILVDGEMFSWYGSRMLKMSLYLLNLREKLDSYN